MAITLQGDTPGAQCAKGTELRPCPARSCPWGQLSPQRRPSPPYSPIPTQAQGASLGRGVWSWWGLIPEPGQMRGRCKVTTHNNSNVAHNQLVK